MHPEEKELPFARPPDPDLDAPDVPNVPKRPLPPRPVPPPLEPGARPGAPFDVPAEEQEPSVVKPPVDVPAERDLELPWPVLPGPQEEEGPPATPQVPVPVAVPRHIPDKVQMPGLLPDNLLQTMKNYVRANRGVPLEVPKPVGLVPLRGPQSQAGLRLAGGIREMQAANESAYARELAATAETEYVRTIQEGIRQNEKSAKGESFLSELGWMGPAFVSAAAIAVGLHALRGAMGGTFRGPGRPTSAGGGQGYFLTIARHFQDLFE